ncbi:histidine kinase [Paenibacillus alginolyticus]|uniref:histidine kinase n=1 Tax=Paenibacillus alginolyticus TaxID=59839 RepID=A0ABT4GLJ7_9BACL|nr:MULTISPECIES: histidine kinase [Paenibacillus]MCY9670216.1 histidine kinase [Paenibacillus alginolyticus]MCY9697081.1 histidine kinase [Paenibacillus alginolyticus]MEC0146289.1 histidine kinase [Paenibacillus alginolyticus]NRF91965.1 histidine kinase [Paenibacillus frigoriresistens]
MRSLRSVILIRLVIVAAVSFLLAAGFTYYFYQKILLKQMIHDDNTKLGQTARQLQYMSDDVVKFSSSLIISNQLQMFFKSYEQLDTFDKFSLLQDTFNYLDDNKGLRKEVTSFALVMPNGEAFWSEARYDNYIYDRMKEEWYQNFLISGKLSGFTEPHQIFFNAVTQSNTISYIINVKDIQQSGSSIGQLILNLDYSSFESLLTFGSTDFDGFLWANDSNHIIYEKKQQQTDPAANDMLKNEALLQKEEGIRKIKGGYLLVNRFAGNNWRLISYTSQHTLIERGKIVIYLLAIFSLASTILILVLIMPAIFRITRPIMRLYHAMNAVSSGNLQTSVSIQTGDELEKLGQGFNRMIDQLRVDMEESIRYEQEKRELELELLLSQLNPHFVYNTLNAVIYMAQKQGNEDIVRMVASFIRILQDAVRMGDGQSLIPLREEISILRDYIAIQAYRYIDIFDVIWEIDDHTQDSLIPRNLIQPFVENAIFHGICPKDEKGTIRISAAAQNGILTLIIEDDGVGIEAEQLTAIWDKGINKEGPGIRHIGLSNTKKRLEHLFGIQSVLQIDSIPEKGTTVKISIPERYG